MRALTSDRLGSPWHKWCDGARAPICWTRHTSHTSHTIFITCIEKTLLPGFLPQGGRDEWRARLPAELGDFAATAVTRVTRPANPGVLVAAPVSRWHALLRRRRRGLLPDLSNHNRKKFWRPGGLWIAERTRRMGHRPLPEHGLRIGVGAEDGASSCCATTNALWHHKTTARDAPVGARATVTAGVCGRGA
jgi:hypothetical protein